MVYDNKIAIVIKSDLQDWQKLNVAAFLASSVAIKLPETHGRAFVTASNQVYFPLAQYGLQGATRTAKSDANKALPRRRTL
jgi:hypothetical protein